MIDATSSFFTRRPGNRFVVPHAPLGERWLLVIHAAVTAAFVLIRNQGFDLKNAGENAITHRLEGALMNDILNSGAVEGFDKLFFGPITRGSEVENYNGEKISKKPDLVFHLQRENAFWDRRQDAIFAECKPVDLAHSLATNYCAVGTDRVGVERFVIGHYAWAMHEGLIIGYVRDGLHVSPHLADSLADLTRHKLLGSPTIPVAIFPGIGSAEALHRTQHDRLFTWRQTGQPATSIALYHSWHDCG
ncbi:MAG: hypothetical protein JWM04_41 [Verrucomicrobiales bacterium]|jgi:hypothetical protein|nr:hypothetical protein [Verrucomicrobiales bacterium]